MAIAPCLASRNSLIVACSRMPELPFRIEPNINPGGAAQSAKGEILGQIFPRFWVNHWLEKSEASLRVRDMCRKKFLDG